MSINYIRLHSPTYLPFFGDFVLAVGHDTEDVRLYRWDTVKAVAVLDGLIVQQRDGGVAPRHWDERGGEWE